MQTVTPGLTGPQQRWAEALESGEFSQGFGYLRTRDSYCCLGVACEVFIRDGGTLQTRLVYKRANAGPTHVSYNGRCDGLPPVVRQHFDLGDCYGTYWNEGGVHSLIRDNDVERFTFPEIAQIMRSQPDHLFVSEL